MIRTVLAGFSAGKFRKRVRTGGGRQTIAVCYSFGFLIVARHQQYEVWQMNQSTWEFIASFADFDTAHAVAGCPR